MARKRKAGDGTVRQRKDGRWEGRIVIGYDDNGYPKTKNILAKTKKECVEKLQKLKEECGGLKPEKVRPEMIFGDWLTYWYENHSKPKIRPTTQETYESRIRLHIIPEIGDIPLNKLTQNDLQQFYGRLKKAAGSGSPTSTAKDCPTEWCVCVTPPAAPHWRRRCRMG